MITSLIVQIFKLLFGVLHYTTNVQYSNNVLSRSSIFLFKTFLIISHKLYRVNRIFELITKLLTIIVDNCTRVSKDLLRKR